MDTAAVSWAGSSDGAINITEITLTGAGTGNLIDLQNDTTGSAGYDIIGTDNSWYVSLAGAALLTGITGCDTIVANDNLSLDASGTGTIGIGGTSTGTVTITPLLALGATLTIVGGADSDAITVDAGDITVTAGLLSLDDDDTVTGNLVIPSSTATSGNPISITADALTTGAALYIDSDNGASFSVGGGYLNFTDGSDTVFHVGRYGALTIAGNAEGTSSITCTKGDLVLSDGALVITAGVFTYTAGDMTMSDGSLAITDADNAATFSVTNNTATTASVVVVAGSGVFTGTTTTSFMTITPSGMTTGTAVYLPLAAMTTGTGIQVVANAITSGQALEITSTATTLATTGRLFSVSSAGTTGTTAILNEFSSAATDETTILKVTASAALAAGVALNVSVAAMTTGTALSIVDGDALTTGALATFTSDSAETDTRSLVTITNDNTAATGTTGLTIQNDATSGAAMAITGTGIVGIDFSALGVADSLFKATLTTDETMKAPQSVAADGFVKIMVGAVAHYIPVYTIAA